MHKGEANRLRREMERVEGERERLREEARRWGAGGQWAVGSGLYKQREAGVWPVLYPAAKLQLHCGMQAAWPHQSMRSMECLAQRPV